jgi:hypothetical protein
MPVKLNSAGGGSVTMDVGSTASNFTQNLPLATTTLVGTDTTQTLTNKTLTSPTIGGTPVMGASVITRGTAVTLTTQTNVDFTGIPSWVRRITVMFYGLSTTGTNLVLVQLGTSGGIEATGYFGSVMTFDNNAVPIANDFNTTGIPIRVANAANLTSGAITFVNITGNDWIATGTQATDATGDYTGFITSRKALSGVLTQVRVTRTSGDTFDAGSINILYE